MDSNRHSCEHAEEDYIDMEVGSQSSIFFTYPRNCSSPHIAREFEFQMSSSSVGRDTAPSPADELFYKGKLLPLHLPPRLQMVEKLLQNTTTYDYKPDYYTSFDESFSTPLFTPTDNNTPFESCHVSRELNPEDYFLECSSSSGLVETSFAFSDHQNQPKKSWTRKLKLINNSSLGSKLKASRVYLKSLFNKTACSTETCAAAAAAASASRNFNDGSIMKAKESSNKYVKEARKSPFGQIQKGAAKQETPSTIKTLNKESLDESGCGGGGGQHRMSFSGAIKRISMTRSSSSLSSSVSSSASTSTDSNGFKELQFFKRSNSVNSDIENPIQAAIAHCKRSQQQQQEEQHFHSRKNVSDLSFCSLSAARVVHHEEQRTALCRG